MLVLMNSECLFWMWMKLLWQQGSLSVYPWTKNLCTNKSWSLSDSLCLYGAKFCCCSLRKVNLCALCVWALTFIHTVTQGEPLTLIKLLLQSVYTCRPVVVPCPCLAPLMWTKHPYWTDFIIHLLLSLPDFTHEVIIPKYHPCQLRWHPLPLLSSSQVSLWLSPVWFMRSLLSPGQVQLNDVWRPEFYRYCGDTTVKVMFWLSCPSPDYRWTCEQILH